MRVQLTKMIFQALVQGYLRYCIFKKQAPRAPEALSVAYPEPPVDRVGVLGIWAGSTGRFCSCSGALGAANKSPTSAYRPFLWGRPSFGQHMPMGRPNVLGSLANRARFPIGQVRDFSAGPNAPRLRILTFLAIGCVYRAYSLSRVIATSRGFFAQFSCVRQRSRLAEFDWQVFRIFYFPHDARNARRLRGYAPHFRERI